MPSSVKQAWQETVDELFDDGGLAVIFLHARNVVTGAAVLAAGVYAVGHLGANRQPGMWTVHLAGYVVALLGAVLLALNLIDGLRRLAKRRHHVLLRWAAILVYVALSLRLTQVLVYFRAT
jgi:hypothetical protein